MSVLDRLDRYQRKHRRVGLPIAVFYKFFDDQGGYLAALITYYGFLSIVPLLLLGTATLGFLLAGNVELEQRVLESTLSQFPVIGDQLTGPEGLSGSSIAVIVGSLGAVYGALGVVQAAQNAMNIAWAVPRNKRPDPFMSRLRSALLLLTAGLAILATTALAAIGSSRASTGGGLDVVLEVGATVIAVTLNTVVFTFAFRLLTVADISIRDVLPGAAIAAVVWQLLQTAGVAFVENVVQQADPTNGVFALVLGLIAWTYVGAVTLVLCVELNVVLAQQLYPRALMTPFSDDVDLTPADRKAYTGYATAQQAKGFQDIDVDFENDGQNATARRRQPKG
ncbi:MAG: YihY/virulence factor BrkB family protein [Actinomycetota bacterium]|nr:YihY/virulence factor BrkB family protein [Actinomycetota bacterium]